MTDPEGLSEQQRTLVNAAHQAIVRSSGLRLPEWLADSDRLAEHRAALARAQDALRAAQRAGVPNRVLERTIKSASAIGRER